MGPMLSSRAFALLAALGGMEPIMQIVPDRRKRIKRLSTPRPDGQATEEQKAIGPKKRGKVPRSKRKKQQS